MIKLRIGFISVLLMFIYSCNNERISNDILKEYENENYIKVIELSGSEIEDNDTRYYLYTLRGLSYFKLQEYSKAHEDLMKSYFITKDITSQEVLKAIATCDIFLSKNEQALQVLSTLVLRNKSDKELFFLRGKAYRAVGEIDKSLNYFF